MRIGIDMLAVQSPGSRGRGIGRYASQLIRALLDLDTANQYVLYAHDGLPTDLIPAAPHAEARVLARDPARGERTLRPVLDRLVAANPDGLDGLLLPSPFELFWGYGPPPRPLHGPKLMAVLHDLIPFLYQEHYLADPQAAAALYGHLERVRRYDVLLTNSEATRADCLRVLGLPGPRVVTIGAASDGRFFVPDRSRPLPAPARAVLERLGIDGAFVYCLGSPDERKNLRGLIDAFGLLPDVLRQGHQLVIGCALTGEEADPIRRHAAQAGVAGHLVLTGELPDADLRVLYQRCAAFAFPSRYEGFGLPLLEAMHCGAAVVAGHNSAQPEVLGDAGLLVNADDPWDLAEKLARLLADAPLARTLGDRAATRARQFRWERAASRALDAMTRVLGCRGASPAPTRVRVRVDRGHSARRRLAVFSPFRPKGSGISDYTANLLKELGERYAVVLYHEPGYVPELGLGSTAFACYDYRLFARHAAVDDYRGVLYQMGNSHYHRFLYETMLRHPGITTLHDFCLAGFQSWYWRSGAGEPDHFRREVLHAHPERARDVCARLEEWTRRPDELQEECSRQGLYLNRRVFERSYRVIVHSPWCERRVRDLLPEHGERTAVVPMGAAAREIAPAQRAAIRVRFGLPADALLLASFGILHPTKMNVEAIGAFAALASEFPTALLVFVGQDLGRGEARAAVEAQGLAERVRFLGRQPDAAFQDLIAAADIGIGLRRPPTNGETSAALLDLLGAGVATVATDTGTFADYPETVVRKVPWDARGPSRLAEVLRELAGDRPGREALGRAARAFVRQHHDWSLVAERYAAVIEDAYEGRTRRPCAPRHPGRRAGSTV